MVGEVLEEDSAHTAFFQGGRTGWDGIDTQLPSVFDFNLWKTSTEVFTGKKPARALRDVLKYDGLYGNINNIALLTSNHDVDRFMSLPGATPEGAMMHIAFTLSSRGIPQIYYGDEIGMTGGHDPDNRKDFPGFVPLHEENIELEPRDARVLRFTERWTRLRRSIRALREGKTVDLYYDDDSYLFGRYFEQDRILRNRQNSYSIIAFNVSEKEKTFTLKKTVRIGEADLATVLADSNRHRSYPGSPEARVTTNEMGDLLLRLPARCVAIYSTEIIASTQN
jgi:glycosidase